MPRSPISIASSNSRPTTRRRAGNRDCGGSIAATRQRRRLRFEAAVKAAPTDPAGHIGLALVHLSKREDAQAAAALETLLAANPGDRYALQLLGTAYRRLGREQDARFALTVGSTGQPAWADPWSDEVGQYRRGFAAMLKEATQLGLERKFDEAIARLDQLVKLRPDDQALRVYLGGMYAAAGRVAEAAAILDPVLAADPSNFDATMHLASGYLFAGDLDRAAEYATRALALRPSNADAAKLRGMVHWQQGRTREAEALLTEAASADPRDPMPHLWMGMILGQQMRYVEARQRFETALSKNPLLGDALIGVADTFAATGAFAQAEVALKRAEQAEPNNPEAAGRARSHSHRRQGITMRAGVAILAALRNRVRAVTEHRHLPRLYGDQPRHRGSKKSPRRAALTSSIAPATRSATRCPKSWAAAPPLFDMDGDRRPRHPARAKRPHRRAAWHAGRPPAVSQPRRRRLR